jgi:hypothetical protein
MKIWLQFKMIEHTFIEFLLAPVPKIASDKSDESTVLDLLAALDVASGLIILVFFVTSSVAFFFFFFFFGSAAVTREKSSWCNFQKLEIISQDYIYSIQHTFFESSLVRFQVSSD